MSDSEPDPLSQPEIPGESKGVGLYLAGTLVLALGAGALLMWRFGCASSGEGQSGASALPPAVQQAVPGQKGPEAPLPLHALPPPPKLEASQEAPPSGARPASSGEAALSPPSAAKGGTGSTDTPAPAAQNPCAACGEGVPSSALTQAVQSAAASAQGCYKRALRNAEVSGSIEISVSIGSTGLMCSAHITKDTLGSAEISSCVLGKFQGKSFPAPKSGCVVINVPLKFEIQP